MPLEVPAQVQNSPYTHNAVVVTPGTNWDFSRTAIPTEIVQLPDPVVVPPQVVQASIKPVAIVTEEGVPNTPAVLTLLFPNNNAAVGKTHRTELTALPKSQAWIVIAHADETEADPLRFAKARARVVTSILRGSGHKVSFVRAATAPLPAAGSVVSVFNNRSVAIYAAP